MDSSDTGSGPEQAEAHRHLIQFLRGLSELDAAFGRWRPAYGSLPAAEAADPRPRTRDEIVTAHGLYADGLLFFADHPRMARLLRQPSAGDVAAAMADAQRRFGAAIAPLDRLMTVRGAPARGAPPTPSAPLAPPLSFTPPAPPRPSGPTAPPTPPGPAAPPTTFGPAAPLTPPGLAAPPAPPPGPAAPLTPPGPAAPPAPPAPAGRAAGSGAAPPGPRVAESPWEVERSAARTSNASTPGRRTPLPSGRRGASDAEPPRRVGRGFAIVMGVVALVIIAILVVAAFAVAHLFLSPTPTALAPSATPTQATLPPSDLPTGSPVDVVSAAEACTAIPSGQVPSQLRIASVTSGIGSDPAVGYSNPYVSVRLGGTVASGTTAFSLIAVILPFQATMPVTTATATVSPSAPPVDRAGTLQLVAYWNGTAWTGALRSWSGGVWGLTIGTGSGVDISQNGATVTIFWQGLAPGDKYGVIMASSTGCADLGLSSSLVPGQTYGSQPTS